MVFDNALIAKSQALLEACRKHKAQLAVAESCTGGLLAGCITENAGSSEVFLGSITAYSNEVKHDLLGTSYQTLETYGAVSEQAARAMAYGVTLKFNCQLAAAITGIAGPTGGSAEKPVGTVHIATACRGLVVHRACHFAGDRNAVRLQAVDTTLDMLMEALKAEAEY